jgi:uncharacterized membrane protein
MDFLHLHLLLNHFPIIGTLFGFLIMAWGLFRKSEAVQHVALGIWFFMAVINLLVMKSGEEAEEKMEQWPGINESALHEHEEAAESANYVMIALGLLSAAGLVVRNNLAHYRRLRLVTLILSVVVMTAMFRIGSLGGKIRHTELDTTSTPAASEQQLENHSEEHEH